MKNVNEGILIAMALSSSSGRNGDIRGAVGIGIVRFPAGDEGVGITTNTIKKGDNERQKPHAVFCRLIP